MELDMALKPHAVQHLFSRFGFEVVLYFDSDIKVYQPLDRLFDKLKDHSLILTPHLMQPLSDHKRPSDLDILRAGIYNGGCLPLRNCDESHRFLAWWKSRLHEHCLIDHPNGLFVDQRWLDFVPGFFPGAGILREPGYNVAYWNLKERAEGEPVYFFHFSGFDPERPEDISRHQNRYRLSTLRSEDRALYIDYAKEVIDRGYREFKGLPYAYGFFDNGIAIPDATRRVYYESAGIANSIPNPFSEAGYEGLMRFWNAAPGVRAARLVTDLGYGEQAAHVRVPDASGERPLPRLAWSIYESRPDVQSAFPNPQAGDRLRFLTWLLSAGVAEHRIGKEFLEPLWREWDIALSSLSRLAQMRHRSVRWAMAAWRRAR
jgi:hypothetical protein